MNDGLKCFHKDDPGYRAWLATHPRGYVLSLREGYYGPVRLHHAFCSTIGKPSPYVRHTYSARKLCSDDRASLLDWAARHGYGVNPCSFCTPLLIHMPPGAEADAANS